MRSHNCVQAYMTSLVCMRATCIAHICEGEGGLTLASKKACNELMHKVEHVWGLVF